MRSTPAPDRNSQTPAPRYSGSRRTAVALLCLAGLVNFLDRGSLGVANGPVRAELHLSATAMGALLSIFSLAYGFAQLPVGALLDRFGARLLLGGALLVWSGAQAATSLVGGFRGFAAMRVVLGLGESPFFPAGVQAIEGWFAPPERGRPTGWMNASTMVAQALAPPVLTALMLAAGWRAMFAAIGGVGLVLGIAWLLLYQNPPANSARAFASSATANPLAASSAGPPSAAPPHAPPTLPTLVQTEASATPPTPPPWRALFRSRTMWGMLLGFSGINYTAWLYLAWLPGYLEAVRHVSIAHTGLLAGLPFAMGACGMLLSGWAADALARRGVDPLRGRKTLILAGMVGSSLFTSLVAGAGSTLAAVLLIGAALFSVHIAGTAAWGVVQFAAPPGRVAAVASIQNFGSFLVASVAPFATGWLLDRTHSFHLALLLCSSVTLAGAFAYWLLVRGPIE